MYKPSWHTGTAYRSLACASADSVAKQQRRSLSGIDVSLIFMIVSLVAVGPDKGGVGEQAIVGAAPDRERVTSSIRVKDVQHTAEAHGFRRLEAYHHGDSLQARSELNATCALQRRS